MRDLRKTSEASIDRYHVGGISGQTLRGRLLHAATGALYLLVTVLCPTIAVGQDLVNGSFENGLADWTTAGVQVEVVASYGDLLPTDGISMLRLTATTREEPGLDPTLPPMYVPDHASVEQTLSLNPGDRLSFDYCALAHISSEQAECSFGTLQSLSLQATEMGMGETWTHVTQDIYVQGTEPLTFSVTSQPFPVSELMLLLDNFRIDFAGLREELPFLPSLPPSGEEPAAEPQPWIFANVPGTGAWFDPPMVSAFDYQATSGLFVEVGVPSTLPDSDGNTCFSSPTRAFNLRVGPIICSRPPSAASRFPALIQPWTADPQGFPTYLKFDQQTASFTMTPVPEPSTIALFAVGAIGLLVPASRRSRGPIFSLGPRKSPENACTADVSALRPGALWRPSHSRGNETWGTPPLRTVARCGSGATVDQLRQSPYHKSFAAGSLTMGLFPGARGQSHFR